MSKVICQSHYLHDALVLSNRAKVIPELVNQLMKFGLDKFDTIVFRGMSGALLVPSIAEKVGKEMLMVRKADGNHSMYGIEGNVALKSYVIIDDLIASGNTLNSIIDGVGEGLHAIEAEKAKCKAIFLYRDARLESFYHKGSGDIIPLFGMYFNSSDETFIYGKSPMDK
jgi:adenine/guanine phosphoribosyltransferase-like PRPP-binding protein